MCPTLIIWGCKDGALEKELAALSTEMVAGEVTVKYIEDCSHWTQMDRPEQVNTFIHEFLKQNWKYGHAEKYLLLKKTNVLRNI